MKPKDGPKGQTQQPPTKKIAKSAIASEGKKAATNPGSKTNKPVRKPEPVAKPAHTPDKTVKPPQKQKALYRERAWEFLSGNKAAAIQPAANKEVLLHKFRWGVIKRFALTGGNPIARKDNEMALPEKPAYEWLAEHKFIHVLDPKRGIYELANKGRRLYRLFFHKKAPRDYARLAA
jgi:hypothetical protein